MRVDARLVVWALVPLVFYSISIGKQPRYMLPVLPPLAVILAATIVRLITEDRRRFLVGCSALFAALCIGLAAFLWKALPLLVTLDAVLARVTVGAVAIAALSRSRPPCGAT